MADGGAPAETLASPSPPTPTPSPLPPLRGLREKMVAAAQALADERRNQSGASPIPVHSPVGLKSSTKPVLDASILRTEERQRLARERREEREKQQAVRESQILEKEKKARVQYEKQLEEKQRRIREQKRKEELRRAAVEEKRKQKIEEDKERYEAVLHRTLERSQRLESRQKRWSWGGSGTDLDGGKQESPSTDEGSKRSTSSANLKPAETLLHKRLSSSAARLNPPSKSSAKRSSSLNRLNNKVPPNSEQPESKGLQAEQKACRSQSGLPESNATVSRLLAPTQASLARSKSAATLSADSKDPSVPLRSRSTDRLKAPASPLGNASLETVQKSETPKMPSVSTGRRAPSPSRSRRSPSPANAGKRAPSPTATRQQSHPSSPRRQGPPSTLLVSKPVPIQRPSITPNVLAVAKRTTEPACRPKEDPEGPDRGPAAAAAASSERELAVAASKTKEDAGSKTAPATTTAEEAARILAEKRRWAREQREREEEERVRKGEVAEEQAPAEDTPGKADESSETAEEERQRQAEQEKMAEIQLQREEAEAKALEEVAKQRQERERIMQRNKQERLARKKRIEEIMRRTRKVEQEEAKDKSNEEDEDEDVEKQDQPEKAKDDFSLGVLDGPELLCSSATLQDESKREADDVFVNGNEQEEVGDWRNGGSGNLGYLTPAKESGPPANETPAENPEISNLPESELSVRFPSHPNGTPVAAWDFEEILDLSAHHSAQSSAHPRSTDSGLLIPPAGPRLAFGEESCRASPLTQLKETTSEL